MTCRTMAVANRAIEPRPINECIRALTNEPHKFLRHTYSWKNYRTTTVSHNARNTSYHDNKLKCTPMNALIYKNQRRAPEEPR